MPRKVDVEILMGLPGSGKTYYSENAKEEARSKDSCFHEEEFEVVHFDLPKYARPQWFAPWRTNLILDGLFLTTDDVIEVIKECKKNAPKAFSLDIKIIYWKEDREACLHNDKNRRKKDAVYTIKGAKYEYPDVARIKKETGFDVLVIEKKVVKKPEILNKLDPQIERYIKGGMLKSDSWVVSGESKSYDGDWNPNWNSMDGEVAPEFSELYDFLEVVCPKLTFLDSRRIFKEFVKVITFEDSDYYSRTTNAQYVCNINKTIEYLESKGYFDDKKED